MCNCTLNTMPGYLELYMDSFCGRCVYVCILASHEIFICKDPPFHQHTTITSALWLLLWFHTFPFSSTSCWRKGQCVKGDDPTTASWTIPRRITDFMRIANAMKLTERTMGQCPIVRSVSFSSCTLRPYFSCLRRLLNMDKVFANSCPAVYYTSSIKTIFFSIWRLFSIPFIPRL